MSAIYNHGPAGDALLSVAREQSPLEELRCHAFLALLETCRSIHRALRHRLAQAEISEIGFTLLAHVVAHEPVSARIEDLAEALELPAPDVSAALGRLEMSGLLSHERAARAATLRPTTAGRKVFSAALVHHLEAVKQLMSVLAPTDVATLDRTCAQLRASVLQSTCA